MKRKMIVIDEEKCTGCGLCVQGCPEGALQIIDGKARLVSENFCDGLGACVGECPEDALKVEEREAQPYDEVKVLKNIIEKGPNVVKEHLKHLYEHGEKEYLKQALQFMNAEKIPVPSFTEGRSVGAGCMGSGGGCPGSQVVSLEAEEITDDQVPAQVSHLRQWPVQLRLIPPHAPFLKNADLLFAADCVPFAYPSFHRDYLAGKVLIVFCPKLDHDAEEYIEKLTDIFQEQDIRSISIVRMEVPCCSGVKMIVDAALKRAGVSIPLKEDVISLRGERK